MKMKNKIIIVAGLLFSLLTNAQTLVFSTVNVNVGTATADVTVTWDDQGAVPTAVNFNASYTFNAAGIQFVSCATALVTCAETAPGSGAISIGGFGSPANGVVATLTFNTSSAAVASYPILPGVPAPNFSPGGQAIAVTNGAINVVLGPQPDYSSAPAGGTTIALNGTIGTNPTADVVITNAGPAGAPDLTGSCALNGGDAASFSIVSGSPFTVAQAANGTVTVDCDATAATMAQLTTSLDCTHNGDGTTEASPVSYPLTCDIAAISPQYTSAPVVGTAIALGQILQGGTNPTSSIDITNTGDLATTLMGTCTAAAPFIVTGGAYSVAQGAAAVTVGVACDATAAPMVYNGTLSCTQNGSNIVGTADYPLTCEVLAAAATGDQNPVSGTASNFVVSPSGTLTSTVVTFSEIGMQGVAITDLTCTVTPGVGFALTAPVAGATVPAAGTFPVNVTFTDPGDGSATAGSLDCTYTDGTGPVAVSYPLNFIIRAVNVPALSMMGYLVLTLGFGLIGFFAFRRRA